MPAHDPSYLEIWLGAYAFMILQYFGGVALLLVGSRTLQRIGWQRRIQTAWARPRQYFIETLIALRTLLINSLVFVCVVWAMYQGYFPYHPAALDASPWWRIALDALIMFVAHDAYFYWTHRIMHHKWLFRWMHLEHHLTRTPTPLTSFRMSVPEAFVQAGFFVLWAWFMPESPISFQIVLAYIIFFSSLGHSGFEWSPRRMAGHPVFGWLTTTTHHDMHHLGCFNKNYGIHFTFWDRVMGTESDAYVPKMQAAIAAETAKNATPVAAPAE